MTIELASREYLDMLMLEWFVCEELESITVKGHPVEINVPIIPYREHTPRDPHNPDQTAKFWDAIDEQIDYLMYLGHSQQCQCEECSRRDRMLALLLEGMS